MAKSPSILVAYYHPAPEGLENQQGGEQKSTQSTKVATRLVSPIKQFFDQKPSQTGTGIQGGKQKGANREHRKFHS